MEGNTTVRIITVALGTFLSELMNATGVFIFMLILLMVIDFITGVLTTIIRKLQGDQTQGLSVQIAIAGFLKKIICYSMLAVAMALDALLYMSSGTLHVTLPTKAFFSTIVCLWFIFSELISIIENVSNSGAKVPGWLEKIVQVLLKKVDEKADQTISDIEK